MSKDNVQPIFIMPENTKRTKGREAQNLNIMAAKLVAETVRTTLGPKGMDKMLVGAFNEVTVTNDGVTILKEMNIDHPTAKMVIEIAKTQENEVGDGTTTAVVLAGELLKQAEGLLEQEIHPTVIAKGYRAATEKALEILDGIGRPINPGDSGLLGKVATTAMTGKGAEDSKELLSDLVVRSVKRVSSEGPSGLEVDLNDVKIETKLGGSVEDSEMIEGIVLDKERTHPSMPSRVESAKVALVDSALEVKSTETDAKISISDPDKLQAFLDMEEDMVRNMVDKLANSGANVVFCQKGIEEVAQHFLAKKGILSFRRVSKSDMEKLSKATGASIVSNVSEISPNDLGKAGVIEEVKTGDDSLTYVRDCKNAKAVTLLIKGGTEHYIAEVKRALEDALGDVATSIKNGKVVAGAGAPEVELAQKLSGFADKLSGREQLAVQAFAKAMEAIPRTLAENAGLDPIDVMTALRSAHDQGKETHGINVFTGKTMDSWKAGVVEPLKVKTQAITSASEVAVMILRIDDVIAGDIEATPPPQGPPGMPPGMPMM